MAINLLAVPVLSYAQPRASQIALIVLSNAFSASVMAFLLRWCR